MIAVLPAGCNPMRKIPAEKKPVRKSVCNLTENLRLFFSYMVNSTIDFPAAFR